MPEANKNPIFISLVGTATQTDVLFQELGYRLPKDFPELKIEFLGTPFKDYSNLRIAGKKKRDYTAAARTCFRWAFFYEYNFTNVKPAFEKGADIIVIRQYGFDLYAGAIAHEDCMRSFSIHHDLVKHGVIELGISPPHYIFTEELTPRDKMIRDRYFAIPSQSYATVEPTQSYRGKALCIAGIIRNQMERSRSVAAA